VVSSRAAQLIFDMFTHWVVSRLSRRALLLCLCFAHTNMHKVGQECAPVDAVTHGDVCGSADGVIVVGV
jgi:hypothetical protein